MKALVYESPNKLSFTDVPDVSPELGEVKLRIKACGICGSDAGYQGLTGRRLEPRSWGMNCDEVTQCAEGVKPETRRSCGGLSCQFLWRMRDVPKGDVHLCLNKRSYGVLAENGALRNIFVCPRNAAS